MQTVIEHSDRLLNEIMILELKLNSILELNGNKLTPEVKYYKKHVVAKKMELNRLNGENYV